MVPRMFSVYFQIPESGYHVQELFSPEKSCNYCSTVVLEKEAVLMIFLALVKVLCMFRRVDHISKLKNIMSGK
jgi:hypothetical protein